MASMEMYGYTAKCKKKKHVNEMLLDYQVGLCLGNRINRLEVMVIIIRV